MPSYRPPAASDSVAPPSIPLGDCLEALLQAELAWQQGRDEDAETLLLAARHGATLGGDSAMVARVEVAMSHFALTTDDDERAMVHLRAADHAMESGDLLWQTRLWLARSMVQRRNGGGRQGEQAVPDIDQLIELDTTRALAVLVLSEFSAWARDRADLTTAERHAARALELAATPSRERGLTLAEFAEVRLAQGRWQDARATFRSSIEMLRELGLARDEGRTLARYALAVAPHSPPGTDDAPAAWLGRAQAVLGAAATWRDLASTRAGFRAHGRRMQDRAIGGNVAARIDALEQAAAQLRNAVAAAVDRADRAIGEAEHQLKEASPEIVDNLNDARSAVLRVLDATTNQTRQVSKVSQSLVDVIESAVVERNRMRGLLDLLAEIDPITEPTELGDTSARVGARLLQADNVVLARQSQGGELEIIGRAGQFSSDPTNELWRSAVEASLRIPQVPEVEEAPATRADARPRGPVLVIPMRGSGISGALYADKLRRSGQFNEHDHQLARLFADYFALAYSRLAAVGAKRLAFEQLSTTLDTIRDGVVAIDSRGTVTNLNTAAARMLRIEAERTIGRSLEEISGLAPLSHVLATSRRVDGTLVRLRHGSFIVTARPIQSESNPRGVVATLVELDRAQRLAQRITAARPRYVLSDVIGASPPMLRALHLARQAASVDASMLITGESGTGKEVFAQAIHTAGPRASEPFVGVNCAAVPRELLEAELFGYERGAFTGARTEGNLGKFELAAEGTILLDEIGDLPLDMQPKLLRVLQERVVVRLGGSVERPVGARVIATTHRNLDTLVRTGRFRLDLLYRLRVLHIALPSLRERSNDVVLLAKAFLERFARAQHKQVRSMSPDVLQALLAYSWPGNVRELANVMEREISLLPADSVELERLQTPLVGARPSGDSVEDVEPPASTRIEPLASVERRAFTRALELCEGNIQRASKALGVSKVTFYAKLRSWGLHPKDRRERGDSIPPEFPSDS